MLYPVFFILCSVLICPILLSYPVLSCPVLTPVLSYTVRQAMDRCHRVGQVRPVVVYRLLTADSVEMLMMEKHRPVV